MPLYSPTSAASYQLITTFTIGAPVANVDFTGIAFDEVIFMGLNITCASSAIRAIRLSTDNGATFFSTLGNYKVLNVSGVQNDDTYFAYHDTAATAARSLIVQMSGLRTPGVPKFGRNTGSASQSIFTADLVNPVNAIRLIATTGNLTGGTGYIFGK
jgi:hypothetical protein